MKTHLHLASLRRFFADPDVAIDLGTANTRLYVLNRGLVADEPTAISTKDAKAPPIHSETQVDHRITPLKGGVVRDIDAVAYLLRRMLKRARRFGLIRSRALVCAPSRVTSLERSNLIEAVRRSGISAVTVVPEPLASAIGAGLDISAPYGQLIVDIGEGLTDVAVVRSRRLVLARTTRKACGDLRSAVQRAVARRKNLFVYRGEAERLVQENGAAWAMEADHSLPARGVDPRGREVSVELTSLEIAEAVTPVISKIVKMIRETVRGLSPDLAAEVVESGICLTGGGACLRGIDDLIAAETSIDVRIAVDPLHATINGASEMLAASSQAGLWETGGFYQFT